MTQLKLSVIERPTDICCPSCSDKLARVSKEEFLYLHDGYYLNDGDSLPIPPPTQADGDCSLEAALMLGQCRKCTRHYYIIEAQVMQASNDVNFAYVTGERDRGAATNAFAHSGLGDGVPATWHVELHTTPDGHLQVHNIGPFSVEQIDNILGPAGVSACQGRATKSPWTEAAALVTRLKPDLYAIARQLADDVVPPG